VLLLAPYAPHTAEELWRVLGHHNTLAYHPWPQHDPALARDEEVEIPVQIKGKVRARIVVPADADAATLEAAARADAKVMEALAGQEIKKVIVVPKKMVNIVT
jgi:leucyl-tRNA synthetase